MTPPSDLKKYVKDTKMEVLNQLHTLTHYEVLDENQVSYYEGMLHVLNNVEDFCEKRKRY